MKLSLRSFACLTLGATLLASEASATWSIVVINRRTREVGIASATCLANFRLRAWTPVLRVGRGAGVAQSFIDGTGQNRLRIWNGIIARETPQMILDALEAQDNSHQTRQYGIVTYDGPPVTFTGTGAGAGVCGVTGQVGDLWYAIQGNVITGDPVCLDAETALLETDGDLGQKVMAAMEAARRRGGDGRCSCMGGPPNSCGSPPDTFTKSAHTAFALVARIGDPDDTSCPGALGCAIPVQPGYYLALESNGNAADPDPVLVIEGQYDAWRAAKAGIADHVLSEVSKDAQQLVADGATRTRVTVRLLDIEGDPVNAQSLSLFAALEEGDPVATPSVPMHLGGNEWALDFTATSTPGRGAYRLTVNNGTNAVQLHPLLHLDSAPIVDLHSTRWDMSASEGGPDGLVINMGPAAAGLPYHVYGSFSGTVPGTPIGGVMLPLNRDRLFDLTDGNPGHPTLTGFLGILDAAGRAEASILIHPMTLAPIVGGRVDFAATVGTGAGTQVAGPAGFDVVPLKALKAAPSVWDRVHGDRVHWDA